MLKERTLLLFAQKVKNIESKVTEKQMGVPDQCRIDVSKLDIVPIDREK